MQESPFLFAPTGTNAAHVWDVLASDASFPDASVRFGLPVFEGMRDNSTVRLFRIGTLVAVLHEDGRLEWELSTRGKLSDIETRMLRSAAEHEIEGVLGQKGVLAESSS